MSTDSIVDDDPMTREVVGSDTTKASSVGENKANIASRDNVVLASVADYVSRTSFGPWLKRHFGVATSLAEAALWTRVAIEATQLAIMSIRDVSSVKVERTTHAAEALIAVLDAYALRRMGVVTPTEFTASAVRFSRSPTVPFILDARTIDDVEERIANGVIKDSNIDATARNAVNLATQSANDRTTSEQATKAVSGFRSKLAALSGN